MGRYDRNRNKKPNKPTFLVASMAVTLMIGIGGTYYVMKNYRQLVEPDTTLSIEEQSDDIVKSETLSNDQKIPGDGELEFIPSPEEPQIEANPTPLTSSLPSDLPDLLSSDDLFRETLTKLSPGLAQWLNNDLLIRRYLVIANDFAQGIRVRKHMSFLFFDAPFTVDQVNNGLYVASPSSFHRYDALVQTIQAVNAKAAVDVYQTFRPLMLQVFSEFSYPKDITLESIVKKALAEIIAAPVIDENVSLVRPSLYYKFTDSNLEALSPVKKQMIRMGPDNTRIIQQKCREFLVELGKLDVNRNE